MRSISRHGECSKHHRSDPDCGQIQGGARERGVDHLGTDPPASSLRLSCRSHTRRRSRGEPPARGARSRLDGRLLRGAGRGRRRGRGRSPARRSTGSPARTPTATCRSSSRRSRSTRSSSHASVRPRRERARRLHVDALAPETVEPTWQLLEGAAGTAHARTTLPGRWRRSVDDAARAAELGLPVRVVKGQWPDTRRRRPSIRRRGLPPGRRPARRSPGDGVAVATHDGRAARRVAAPTAWRAGTPCEAELFYGLPFRGAGACRSARRGSGSHLRPVWRRRRAVPHADVVRQARPPAWWLVQDLLLGKDKTWRGIKRHGRCARDPRRAGRRFDLVGQLGLRAAVVARLRSRRVRWGEAIVRRGDEVVGRLPYTCRRRARADDDRPATV